MSAAAPPLVVPPLVVPPLAAVAHELRTPLQGVLGCAALLAGTALDDEQRAHLAALTEAARHALAFADDALAIARLADAAPNEAPNNAPHDAPRAHVPVRPGACDVREVMAGVARTLAPRAAARGLALSASADPAVPGAVRADPRRLREVLLNLGANAVAHTHRGGVRLRARLEAADAGVGWLAVDVVDTGPGLTPERRARLFRAWDAGPGGGAGLGLVLARALAERMGGSLAADGAPGAGSTFTLRVPADAPATVRG